MIFSKHIDNVCPMLYNAQYKLHALRQIKKTFTVEKVNE